MLKVTGISEKKCFITGTTENVVDVRMDDKSFQGAIAWTELIKVIKRNSNAHGKRSEQPSSGESSNGVRTP